VEELDDHPRESEKAEVRNAEPSGKNNLHEEAGDEGNARKRGHDPGTRD
jgi:hypothetical protein